MIEKLDLTNELDHYKYAKKINEIIEHLNSVHGEGQAHINTNYIHSDLFDCSIPEESYSYSIDASYDYGPPREVYRDIYEGRKTIKEVAEYLEQTEEQTKKEYEEWRPR